MLELHRATSSLHICSVCPFFLCSSHSASYIFPISTCSILSTPTQYLLSQMTQFSACSHSIHTSIIVHITFFEFCIKDVPQAVCSLKMGNYFSFIVPYTVVLSLCLLKITLKNALKNICNRNQNPSITWLFFRLFVSALNICTSCVN